MSYIDTIEVILSDRRDTGAGTTENLNVGDLGMYVLDCTSAVAHQSLRITSKASMQRRTTSV